MRLTAALDYPIGPIMQGALQRRALPTHYHPILLILGSICKNLKKPLFPCKNFVYSFFLDAGHFEGVNLGQPEL